MSRVHQWAVTLDIEGPALRDDQIDALVDELGEAVSARETRTSTTMTVNAVGEVAAIRAAHDRLRRAVSAVADDVSWRVVMAHVLTTDEQDAELARPVIPPLVGVSEAAKILGVSRQRAHQLVERLEPVATLASGPIFLEATVRAFSQQDRPAGRPVGAREQHEAAHAIAMEQRGKATRIMQGQMRMAPVTRAGAKKAAASKSGVTKAAARKSGVKKAAVKPRRAVSR